jgi:hypothetical protein
MGPTISGQSIRRDFRYWLLASFRCVATECGRRRYLQASWDTSKAHLFAVSARRRPRTIYANGGTSRREVASLGRLTGRGSGHAFCREREVRK